VKPYHQTMAGNAVRDWNAFTRLVRRPDDFIYIAREAGVSIARLEGVAVDWMRRAIGPDTLQPEGRNQWGTYSLPRLDTILLDLIEQYGAETIRWHAAHFPAWVMNCRSSIHKGSNFASIREQCHFDEWLPEAGTYAVTTPRRPRV